MLNFTATGIAHWFVMIGFGALFGTLVTAYGQLISPSFALPLIGHFIPYEFMSELIKLSKSKVNSDVIKSINDLDVLKNKKKTIVGLIADPERLVDIRKNRLNTLSEEKHTSYVDLDKIKEELEESKKIFKLNNIPIIDVTRKSVEETAASIIKIHEIKNS